ncbi:hypothetical protein [Actinomadura oligospora]|uniref:hypothetical protein n=1 Tax=Actinomadura oligospora TaxID=111804 RepID=UPI0004BB738A|nr:hypothetical protein [Actinomadura oligospora]
MTTSSHPEGGGLSRGLLALMAVATGLAAAGNYFAQPLLDLIGRELDPDSSQAPLLVLGRPPRDVADYVRDHAPAFCN